MVLAIVFMYIFAFLLIPLLGFTLYVAFDGDRWRAGQEAANAGGPAAVPAVAAAPDAPAPATTPAAASDLATAS